MVKTLMRRVGQVEKDLKEKMNIHECECKQGDIKSGIQELRVDVKEITKALYELIGEVKKNGNGKS